MFRKLPEPPDGGIYLLLECSIDGEHTVIMEDSLRGRRRYTIAVINRKMTKCAKPVTWVEVMYSDERRITDEYSEVCSWIREMLGIYLESFSPEFNMGGTSPIFKLKKEKIKLCSSQ